MDEALAANDFHAKIGRLEVNTDPKAYERPPGTFLVGQDLKILFDGKTVDFGLLTKITLVIERDSPVMLTFETIAQP